MTNRSNAKERIRKRSGAKAIRLKAVSPARSRNMSAIRSANTTPEIAVRRAIWRAGFRYRLHDKRLPGRPDVAISKYRTVIFVNGCFWHAHRKCPYYRLPKSNRAFWHAKLLGNRSRDRASIKALRGQGWKVGTIWECALRHSPDVSLTTLGALLAASNREFDISWNPKMQTLKVAITE